MKPFRHIPFLALVLMLICGCSADILPSKVDPSEYKGIKANRALIFDLSVDHSPRGGALINSSSISKSGRSTLVLPFKISGVSNNRQLLNTQNSFSDYSIINFLHQNGVTGVQAVSFKPSFSSMQSGQTLANASGSVYFVSEGLERKFIYKFSNPAVELRKQLIAEGHKDIFAPTEIVVKLPVNSTGMEIRGGKTAIPSHIHQLSNARVYPGVSQVGSSTRHLEIRYEVPANSAQKLFAEGAIKLLGVLIAPFLLILFLPVKNVKIPLLRKGAIATGILIQLAVWLYLGYLVYNNSGTITDELWIDLALVIIGTIASVVAYMVVRDAPKDNVTKELETKV